MRKTLKVVVSQSNFLVGDIAGNARKIIDLAKEAKETMQGDIIIFPELALTSYPPEDLLLRKDFLSETAETLQYIATQVKDIDLIVGYPQLTTDGLYNAAAVIQRGKIVATYYKQCLPNYGVFDEKRYFITGTKPCIFNLKGIPIALTICEDMWYPQPMAQAVAGEARLVISINASPYDYEKPALREKVLRQRVHESNLPIVYVHGVGAHDELVFDGGSMILNNKGEVCAHAGFFNETLLPVTISVENDHVDIASSPIPAPLSIEASIYQALVLGLKDYINKNIFPGVLLGLSGGIDSALTLTLAVDALGKERVQAFFLPSRFSSELSFNEAKKLAENLGVKFHTLSIEPIYQAFLNSLSTSIPGKILEKTDQNIQSRCRAITLMAMSNNSNYLLLTTGNKSEMAVGYATLYGDMAGGFAVLKDIYKTLVYKLVAYRNSISPVISQEIIKRPPSAELAPNQKDQDTLPPYDVLDRILGLYVEKDWTVVDIVAKGFDEEIVKKIIAMVKHNEYKRRQAPPGVKITPRAFGRDRRYPITSGFITQ